MSLARVRVIALGSPHGGDDEAALRIAAALLDEGPGPGDPTPGDGRDRRGVADVRDVCDVIIAGRPGPGLVDLLDDPRPAVLIDVVRSGAPPGTVHELALAGLADAALGGGPLSSHGFGPAEALRLAAALGRPPPRGAFVGVEGATFGVGAPLSPAVAAAMEAFLAATRAAIARLADEPGMSRPTRSEVRDA